MKKQLKQTLVVALASFSLCGCLEQLQALNSALSKTNSALTNGKTAQGAADNPLIQTSTLSTSQKEAIQHHLRLKIDDTGIARAREEAKGNIEKVLELSACFSGYDIRRYLAAYSTADTSFNDFVAPMAPMEYHPHSQCLTVKRVDSWRMPAKNALSFRALYVSDQSAESRSVLYNMVKQPDGAWLFR